MSTRKELDFFVGERTWRRGRRWYERQFRPMRRSAENRARHTPHIPCSPASDTARRLPDAKLVTSFEPGDTDAEASSRTGAGSFERRSGRALRLDGALRARSRSPARPYSRTSRLGDHVMARKSSRSQRVERVHLAPWTSTDFWSAMEIERFTVGGGTHHRGGAVDTSVGHDRRVCDTCLRSCQASRQIASPTDVSSRTSDAASNDVDRRRGAARHPDREASILVRDAQDDLDHRFPPLPSHVAPGRRRRRVAAARW